MNSIQRILVIKMWALGDILMTTPLLTALKVAYPGCSITWLSDSAYCGIVADNVLLDSVIGIDFRTWQRDFRYGNIPRYLSTGLNIRRDLADRKFDLVISFNPDKWWTLWFNAAPQRVGVFPSPGHSVLRRYYTACIDPPTDYHMHNVDRSLLPMQSLGFDGSFDKRMVLSLSRDNDHVVEQFLVRHGCIDTTTRFVVLHPGASQQTKCWPAENFAQLADLLSPKFKIVITGSSSEKPLAERIRDLSANRQAIMIAAGELKSIGESASLVNRASGVVTGDTSVLHIASALTIPTVALYGSTRPNNNEPLYGKNTLLFDNAVKCSPCYSAHCKLSQKDYLACLQSISPKVVYGELNRLIDS